MSKNIYKILLVAVFLLSYLTGCAQKKTFPSTIDLSGEWLFAYDIQNNKKDTYFPSEYNDHIQLPGTMDTNEKGPLNKNKKETSHLSRLYKFIGKAWYQKEVNIPRSWKDKVIELTLERTKPTHVWIDGKLVGENNNVSTEQIYDLSKYLSLGKHTVTILVDNGGGVPSQVMNSSHAYSKDTQTNWNGIIGKIALEAKNKVHIQSIRIYPDALHKKAKVMVKIAHASNLNSKTQLTLQAQTENAKQKITFKKLKFPLHKGQEEYTFTYKMGKKASLWSELNPVVYQLNVAIKGIDQQVVDFGLRNFDTRGTQFTINGKTAFLRGKHDACVFPLTGYPPMEVKGWIKYFKTLKDYGINYVRFHSWSPPEACFEAADRMGIYLQPELPIWGGLKKDKKKLNHFLKKEGKNIIEQYGNHPSFVMFALGNELSGDVSVMKDYVHYFRTINDSILYAYGSNNFLGYKGQIEGEDFLTTCRIGSGENYSTDVRASFSFADEPQGGIMNNTYPNSNRDFSEAISKSTVPVISHETGQYQSYPDYDQIQKYTGILKPWNLEIFKERLQKAGMVDQAKDFARASGRWAALLYKADIEMELRTRGIGGFQLLDLMDYPGQGSAYVGILDAFMDNKGAMSAKEWKNFCNKVVPLFSTKGFTWTNNENLTGTIKIANYSNVSLKGKNVNWEIKDTANHVLKSGSFVITNSQRGVIDVGKVNIDLSTFYNPQKVFFTMAVSGTPFYNKQALWVYPAQNENLNAHKDILIGHHLNKKVFDALEEGKKVLLFPDSATYKDKTVGGLFQTDYWNYRMFKGICENIGKPVSPGTLGLLTNPNLPIFDEFPTDYHTNWQWYPIIKHSYPLIMDRMPDGYKPLVQVIDNVERNHKLGLIFEFKVGKGKLLVCMADLKPVRDKPEVKQFYKSLLDYMDSGQFNPAHRLSESALKTLFNKKREKKDIKGVKNISYE